MSTKSFYALLQKTLVLVCLCWLSVACSRVNQVNFEKVTPTMSMSQVVAILGEPTSSESINVAGISGTSATWKSYNGEIKIQFLNDQVAIKSFHKNREMAEKENTAPDKK